MKKSSLILFIFLQSVCTLSASENVPSKITFANLKLTIKPDARQIIAGYIAKLKQNETYFQSIVDRADLYFPIVEAKFKEEGVPDDIKYLCIQESELVPTAVSSSNAVGYWQFKKPTAQEVGLTVDKLVDERKNIASASRAAAKYLKNNNKKLDNWAYAIVSYNTGLTGAKKYIQQKYLGAGSMEITRTTHWYLLKFISHKLAFENEVGRKKTKIHLKEEQASEGSSIAKIAKKYKVSKEEILPYNQWIAYEAKIPANIPVIVPLETDQKETVVVASKQPKEKKRKLIDIILNRGTVDYDQLPSSFTVNGVKAIIAKKGESLKEIAEKVGKKEEDILKYNELVGGTDIVPNQHYFIEKKKKKALVNFHTVKKGETLASIAQQYGVVQSSIMKYNKIDYPTELKENRILWMRKKRPKSSSIAYEEETPKTKEPVVEPKEEAPKKIEPIQKENKVEEKVIEEPKETSTPTIDVPVEPKEQTIEIPVKEEPITKPTAEEQKPKEQIVKESSKEKEEIKEVKKVELEEVKDTTKVLTNKSIEIGIDPSNIDEEIGEKITTKDHTKKDTSSQQLTGDEQEKLDIPMVEDTKEKEQALTPISTPAKEQTKDSVGIKEEPKQQIDAPKKTNIKTHTVAKGETLYSISRKYGLKVEEIKKYNELTTNDLNIGQVLTLAFKAKTHTVVKGDTFYAISKKYNISVKELQRINDKKDFSLSIGEELKLTEE